MIPVGLNRFPNAKACSPASAPRRCFSRAALLALCLLSLSVLLPPDLKAQASPTALQVQATYLFKFAAFVTWPAPPQNDMFAICVLGRDPFAATLDSTITGESIAGKRLAAIRIASPQQASQCRILFISSSEQNHLKSVVTALEKLPVLTVSDIPGFIDRGGMIQFVLDNGRVRFAVNQTAAEQAGLNLSSQLLKVAYSVKHDGGRD